MQNQTERKDFRLRKQDIELLERNAKACGMTHSAYLRQLIQNRPIDHPEIKKLLKELLYEVNRIGNNVNQIAHHINEGFYFKEDRNQLLKEQKELELQVAKIAELLRKQG